MMIFWGTQIYSIGIDQLIILFGIFFFFLGLGVTIFSKIKSKETEIQSKSVELEIKGYPVMIDSILTPSYPTLLKIICLEKNGQNTVYKLINNIQKEQGGRFARSTMTSEYKKEEICEKGIINFELYSNSTYQLWVRPFEGVTKEGLDEVSKIFSKYTIVKEGNKNALKRLSHNYPTTTDSIPLSQKYLVLTSMPFSVCPTQKCEFISK